MIDEKAATFLPQPPDSNNEIRHKLDYLNNTLNGSLKMITGSTPGQVQPITPANVEATTPNSAKLITSLPKEDIAKARSLGYTDDQIAQFISQGKK